MTAWKLRTGVTLEKIVQELGTLSKGTDRDLFLDAVYQIIMSGILQPGDYVKFVDLKEAFYKYFVVQKKAGDVYEFICQALNRSGPLGKLFWCARDPLHDTSPTRGMVARLNADKVAMEGGRDILLLVILRVPKTYMTAHMLLLPGSFGLTVIPMHQTNPVSLNLVHLLPLMYVSK